MECWTCSTNAAATCRFCGRAVCRDHAQSMPYVLSTWGQKPPAVHALVVEDAIHCGTCHPHPAPIRLDLVFEQKG